MSLHNLLKNGSENLISHLQLEENHWRKYIKIMLDIVLVRVKHLGNKADSTSEVPDNQGDQHKFLL